jgi:hypothetical protein
MLKVKSNLLLFLLGLGLSYSISALQPRPAVAQQAYKTSENITSNPSGHLDVYFDNRFSDDEVDKLSRGFLYVDDFIIGRGSRRANPYSTSHMASRFYSCYMKYYKSPWDLMSHEERMNFTLQHLEDREARGEIKTGNVLQKLQKAYEMQVDGRKRRIYVEFYSKPRAANGLINTAYVQGLGAANRPEDLHIYVNQTWVASDLTNARNPWFLFGGTLLHELIHLIGYDHPRDIEPNFSNVEHNIVYESSWCASRNMKDKPPGSIQLTDDNSSLFVD